MLPLFAVLSTVTMAVIYSKATIYVNGSPPSAAAKQTMSAVWMYSALLAMPIALILAVLGKLPGTRLRNGVPNLPKWELRCYQILVGVALCGMLLSIVRRDEVGDNLTIGALVIAFIVAGLAKSFGFRRRRLESRPNETDTT